MNEERINESDESLFKITNTRKDNAFTENEATVYEKLTDKVNDKSESKNADIVLNESTQDKTVEDKNICFLDDNDDDGDNQSIIISSKQDESFACMNNTSELFYDFQAENFHAEQGAPFVCTICNNVGHLKSECPELILPTIIDLPNMSQEWIQILSLLCEHINERFKPRNIDIENREKILKQLQKKFEKDYQDCSLHAFGSFYNGFGFRKSDLDVCIVFKNQQEENTDELHQIMRRILKSMKSSSNEFESVQPILHAKVPIIRSRHRLLQIDIDISFHNMLAIENTRLLRTYADMDQRVSQIGYMIKHLAKICDIGDASRGTLSSYAYIIMVIYFLQQIQPPVLPVLQQLSDNSSSKEPMHRKYSKWNVYFYENLNELNKIWKNENNLSVGELWIEFLRFYTEQFNYDERVVTIRQFEPLLKHEKGWFRQAISIEDPFELNHNLAGGLSIRNWTIIRRVFIRARQQFGLQSKDIDVSKPDMQHVESILFNINELCPANAPRRCAECKEPYHIRKRCPKSISSTNEKEKSNRLMKSQQQLLINNQYEPHSNASVNAYQFPTYLPYYYTTNEYQYRFPMIPHQHVWAQPYSNEQPLIYSNSSYQAHNLQIRTDSSKRPFSSQNQKKRCFYCGSANHLKAQCSQFNSNNHQR